MSFVSIIIPNFNGASWLSDTLDSCLKQDHSIIKEIIVVDDYSTDASWELLLEMQKEHSKIKVFKNKKKGANAARNLGFQLSSGSFIQFLDADDLLSEHKISTQFQMLQQSKEGSIASCGWAHFSRDIGEAIFSPSKIWKDYDDPLKWLLDAWTGGGMMITSCWLTPRHLIERAGLWDETLLKNQDGEFFCRVLLESQMVKFSENAQVFYRRPQKGNVSQRISYESAVSLLKSYQSYEKNIRKKVDDQEVRKVCAINYQNFIYQIHPNFKDLCEEAKKNISNLKVKSPIKVGGKNFQVLSKILGFELALLLREKFLPKSK